MLVNGLSVVHLLCKLLLLLLLGLLRLLGLLAWWGGVDGRGLWLRPPEPPPLLAVQTLPGTSRRPLTGDLPSHSVQASLHRPLPLPVLPGEGRPPHPGTHRLRLAVVTLASVQAPFPPADLRGQHRLPALQQARRVGLRLQRLPGLLPGLPVGGVDLVSADAAPALDLRWTHRQPVAGGDGLFRLVPRAWLWVGCRPLVVWV